MVSLNLRWRPYVISLRQALGLEPILVKSGEVQREPLAQGAGSNTFFVDEQSRFWKVVDDPNPHMEPIAGHKFAKAKD